MSWWSRVKSAVRQVVRIAVEAVSRFTVGLGDLLLGFVAWPRKKLRLYVLVLADENGPLVSDAALTPSLDYLVRVLDERFNVKVVPYSRQFVEAMKDPAPAAALDAACGVDGLDRARGWPRVRVVALQATSEPHVP